MRRHCLEADGHFATPRLEALLRYRVVVATCCMAAKLHHHGVPRGHFGAVLVDEAGNAFEPEVVAAFAGFVADGPASGAVTQVQPLPSSPPHAQPIYHMAPITRRRRARILRIRGEDSARRGCPGLAERVRTARRTPRPGPQVVLAGDPKQLGPVVRSAARGLGLGESLLERLMALPCYARDPARFPSAEERGYDGRVLTKLVRNYRSHPALLDLPNALFYDGDLLACADPAVSQGLARWQHLPPRARAAGFPLLFHGVEGLNEREGNSPSWFNTAECVQVRQLGRAGRGWVGSWAVVVVRAPARVLRGVGGAAPPRRAEGAMPRNGPGSGCSACRL